MKSVEIGDILDYRFVENLKYSPDGKNFAFVLAKADEEKNSYKRDILLYKDGKLKPYTSGGNNNFFAWLDDDTILLTKKTDSKTADITIYRLKISGGEAQPWIELPFAPIEFKKLREGLFAASAIIDSTDPNGYLDDKNTRKEKAKKKEKEREYDYKIIDEVPYWSNGVGFINGKRTALFLIHTEPKLKIERITEGNFNVDDWETNDGKILFCGDNVGKGIRGISNKLFEYDVAQKEINVLFAEKDWRMSSPFFMGGKMYVMATQGKEYGVNETAVVYEVKNGKIEQAMAPKFTLYNSAGSDVALLGGKGRAYLPAEMYTLATVEDHTELWKFDKDFNKVVLCDEDGVINFFDVGKEKIAYVSIKADRPQEIYLMNLDGSGKERLSNFNDDAIEDKYVALPERVDYESCGLSLHGWVLYPKDYDENKKYPAVLDIHGGPRTVYAQAFFHEMQVWASRGYFVFFTNIKGSDGRGDEFADVCGDYGYTDYENLMDFTDAVLKKYPAIDQKRVCETGGSYGGFMTNWIIGHTDRFCCAASQRSISNWISFSLISDIGPFFGTDQCGVKDIFKETDKMWEHSPLKYAQNVKTPTLFIHSEEDYRCPLPEGMQMMQALAVNGVDTKMVLFHGENHELSRSGKPLHRIKRLTEITNWFDKYAK
jgi:dipeptidyl aminopeptidase/acylaminoacyl peptidase